MRKPWGYALLVVCALLAWIVGCSRMTHQAEIRQQQERSLGSLQSQIRVPAAGPRAVKASGVAGGVAGGVIGGVLGGLSNDVLPSSQSRDTSYFQPARQTVAQHQESAGTDRKLIQVASLDLVVSDVAKVANACEAIAEKFGGYVETENIAGGEAQDRQASIKIRVPADRLKETLGALRNSATKVRNQEIKSEDVTLHYVDLQARLHNKQAEEQQYLELMKRTGSVKDLLSVSEQISNTREEIETMQAEMNYLSHQIAMASITISLLTPARELQFAWQPLQNAQRAWRATAESLADWADWMVSALISIPVFLAWFLSMLTVCFFSWRMIRALWRTFGLPGIRRLWSRPDALQGH